MKKLLLILTTVFLFILALGQIFSLASIQGGFMQPAISSGETAVFLKHTRLDRGVIVTYYRSPDSEMHIGRIVALPGESYQFQNNQVYISTSSDSSNFVLLEESYPTHRNLKDTEPVTLSPSQYLILYDGNNFYAPEYNHIDSRLIDGKMLFKL